MTSVSSSIYAQRFILKCASGASDCITFRQREIFILVGANELPLGLVSCSSAKSNNVVLVQK